MKYMLGILSCVLLFSGCTSSSLVYPQKSTQAMTVTPGQNGQVAVSSVFRIIWPKGKKSGSAFLHKSGKVITAAHIVEGCKNPEDVFIIISKGKKGKRVKIKHIEANSDLDLALLTPESKLTGNSYPISSDSQFTIGSQVTTWGYPRGYQSNFPLLSVGYLSGEDHVQTSSGKLIKRWVVNGAFNLGNSGGPLIHVESGKVIGVVSSKLAPIPTYIEDALEAMKHNNAITVFTRTMSDGSKVRMSTAQVAAEVLQHLRSQTQLVIGHAVETRDIRAFLKANGIDP